MKKLIGILIVATGIGTPVLAQSFDPDMGTGNTISAAPAPVASTAARTSGIEAYAMSGRRKVKSNAGYASDDITGTVPTGNDNTGGGSKGYNEKLLDW
jgi:hypothetical protein